MEVAPFVRLAGEAQGNRPVRNCPSRAENADAQRQLAVFDLPSRRLRPDRAFSAHDADFQGARVHVLLGLLVAARNFGVDEPPMAYKGTMTRAPHGLEHATT